MDKKSPKGRKRTSKGDENYWDCSVCTFRNNAEAFKCSMCDVRKGTSTRKPRINADLVAAQVQQAQALTPPPPSSSSTASISKSSTPDPSEDEDSLQSLPMRAEDNEESSSKELPPSIELPSEDEPSTSKGQSKKDRKKKLDPVPSSSSSSGPPPPPAKKKYNINPAKLRNVDRSSATYHSVTVNDFTVVITEFKPKIKKEKLKKPQKKTEASGKKSTNGTTVLADGSPSTNEVNGHEETMRNNNADASDSRSS